MTDEKKKTTESASTELARLTGVKQLSILDRMVEAVVPNHGDLSVKPVIPMNAAPSNPKNNGKK